MRSGRCWRRRRSGNPGASRSSISASSATVEPDRVTITPTYTGCPATQVIERDIRDALDAAGYRDVRDRDRRCRRPGRPTGSAEGGSEAPAPTASRRRPGARRRMPAMRLGATRRRSAASARRRARRCGAAAPAPSRSTCSSATDERRLSTASPSPRWSTRPPTRGRSASTCPTELRETFRFKPGQHLTLKAEIGGEEVRRNYSLCVAPQDEQLKVTVKRIAGGALLQLGERQAQARRPRSR